MSSDNYYTIRQAPDGLWYLFHGFVSSLDDGFVATSKHSAGFETEQEVLSFYSKQDTDFMQSYYSEYGLLVEPPAEETLAARTRYFSLYPEELEEEGAEEALAEYAALTGTPAAGGAA